MAIDPHCIPCEKNDCWIEIDVRDEHNRSFKGQKATLTDATGTVKKITLKDGPVLVKGLAVGSVEIKFETKSWLKTAQSREALKEGESTEVPAYTSKLLGHCDVSRTHIRVTSGDLCMTAPEPALPEGHQAGQTQPPRFITKKSYVIEVKGYQLTTLRIGVFFDGTGNNSYNADKGLLDIERWLLETCSDPAQREKELLACQLGKRPVDGSYANDITNVGKLSTLYIRGEKTMSAAAYIGGIGTRDPITGKEGKEYLSDDTLTQGLDLDWFGENTSIIGKVTAACELIILKAIEQQLKNVLPEIECIHRIIFDVFGFSRGAAAARHFINVIDQKNDHPLVKAIANNADIRLKAGFDWKSRDDVRVSFVGLFDTVRSSFNPSVKVRLNPESAERVVHLTALDEVRKHFPLSRITNDSAGTSIAPHFTEIALPGAHSDIGGGYYSRWSIANPNGAPALTECIELACFTSIEDDDKHVPNSSSKAYKQAEAYANEKVAQGWADRVYSGLPRGATPPLGAISLVSYSFKRTQGKDNPFPKKAVYVEVHMNRVVEGEYSRIPLHMMVQASLAAGVPLKEWDGNDSAYQLQSLAVTPPKVSLEKLDAAWANAAIPQGVATSLAHQLSSHDYQILRQEYLHHSASNQGIANPANTSKYEKTVSKERRELIGNEKA